MKSLSRVRLFATPWTAAYQAPPSMRFSRQQYWSGVPLAALIIYGVNLIILWVITMRNNFLLYITQKLKV